jgi:hypothetical protein
VPETAGDDQREQSHECAHDTESGSEPVSTVTV